MEKTGKISESDGWRNTAVYSRAPRTATLSRYPVRSLTKFPPPNRKRKCGCEFPRTFPEIRCNCYRRKRDDFKYIPPLPQQGNEHGIRSSTRYANASLSYLRKQGHDYELVSPGYFGGGTVGGGSRFHINFKAKRAHDPNAPVETFFSQAFCNKGRDGFFSVVPMIECCVSLGNSDSLPRKIDNYGCQCRGKYVLHPKGGCEGMLWGPPP